MVSGRNNVSEMSYLLCTQFMCFKLQPRTALLAILIQVKPKIRQRTNFANQSTYIDITIKTVSYTHLTLPTNREV